MWDSGDPGFFPPLPDSRSGDGVAPSSPGEAGERRSLMLSRAESGLRSCHLLVILQTLSGDTGEARLLPPHPVVHGKNSPVCSAHWSLLFLYCLGR